MTPLPFEQRGAWRRYTTADGLAANQTEHIVEDADGYLWIATTTGGVSRFDGDEFRTYTTRDGLPSDGVYALCVDRTGRLWCGTTQGLCWLDGDRFRPFEGDSGVASDWIMYLFEDSHGRVWVKGFHVCGFCDGERYTDLGPRPGEYIGDRRPRRRAPLRQRRGPRDTQCLSFELAFKGALKDHPEIALAILPVVVKRFRETNDKLLELQEVRP